MNFFEHQQAARRASRRAVVLFVLAIAATTVATALVLSLLLYTGTNRSGSMLFFILVGVPLVILGGSWYRIKSLRSGGDQVARQLGGIEVSTDTVDPALRRLVNVVEEMALASGVPVPRLYVLPQEPGINAFAAGYSPSDAVVAVTQGTLKRLNRDELQAVVAHEFSHILNGDMRINIRLMGGIFGLTMLGMLGQKMMRARTRTSRDSGGIALLGAVLFVMGSIGVFFGRLIKAGFGRQREYLADASAVQFTRQTVGLVGALKKIGGLQEQSYLADRTKAEEVSHMLFGEGLRFSSLFATHPPLIERIRRLDPSFNEQAMEHLRGRWIQSPPDGLQEDIAMGLAEPGMVPPPLPSESVNVPVEPSQTGPIAETQRQTAIPGETALRTSVPPPLPTVAARAGNLPPPLPPLSGEIDLDIGMLPDHVGAPEPAAAGNAQALIANLPPSLRQQVQHHDSACPVVLALLIDDDADIAKRQQSIIATHLGSQLAEQTLAIYQTEVVDLHPLLKLPLAALAFPALRRRSQLDLRAFAETIEVLTQVDGQLSVFEYCLSRLLQVQVRDVLEPARHVQFGRRKLSDVERPIGSLLALMAKIGHADPEQAKYAYLGGMRRLLPQANLPYVAPAFGLSALDSIWPELDALDPLAKEMLVEAIAEVISHDRRIGVAEAELMRTVCGVLHCPMPMLPVGMAI